MSALRLVSYSSEMPGCGIADYNRNLLAGLPDDIVHETKPVTYDRIGTHRPAELWKLRRRYQHLARQSGAHDVVLLQYYDRLWNGTRPIENTFPSFLKQIDKPAIMVVHEWPKEPPARPHGGSAPVRLAKRLLHAGVRHLEIGGDDYAQWVGADMFRQMQHLIVHTPEFRDRLVALGVPPSRISLAVFPIHAMPAPCWPPPEVRQRFGLGERKVLLLLGAAHPRKGYEIAIQAMVGMPDDVVLVMVCPTRTDVTKQQVQALVARAAELGVADHLVHIDFLESEELASVFAVTSIALSPFTQVTGSSSLAHFLAGGLPILTSDLPAIRTLRDAGAALELVPPGDPDALRAAARRLLADDASRSAAARVNAEFGRAHSFASLAERLATVARTLVRS